jgi:hypothetical protein
MNIDLVLHASLKMVNKFKAIDFSGGTGVTGTAAKFINDIGQTLLVFSVRCETPVPAL